MRLWTAFFTAALICGAARAQLPIKEVTVFKDGHAFVLAEGELPVHNGEATMEGLPQPVLGTFWPYAAQSGVTLTSVTAGLKDVPGERGAATLKELFALNVGKPATIREIDGALYSATVLSVTDGLILLQTEQGVKATEPGRIRDATFAGGQLVRSLPSPTTKAQLTLKLSGASGGRAKVGVMYLQKGLRWIPSYKIDLDGKSQAKVKLQATLVNELADLDGATANLVIGVPSFAFKDTLDPIALQETAAQLSGFFARDSRTSNALGGQMSQMAGYAQRGAAPEAADPSGPAVTGGEQNEDLFVFTVKNVTLHKGERMTLPVAELTLPYKNVYTLELLPSATRNASGYYDAQTNTEFARLAASPKARHVVRLTNASPFPLTTAPALLMSQGKVVAQGQTLFTAKGGTSDIALTDAPDISVKRSDKESERTPKALQSDGYDYFSVQMKGDVELCNYRKEDVEIEVTRYVLGKVDSATASGAVAALDPLADDSLPGWLGQIGNSLDRIRFTGLGKIFWKATLPAGGKTCVNLDYAWHYFTR